MTPFLSVLMLGFLALFMGGLLFIPALLEWLRPKDAASLSVDNLWSRRDIVFAEHFRRIAEPWWKEKPAVDHDSVQLPEGYKAEETFLARRLQTARDVIFNEEIYVKEELELGANNHARAILSDGSAVLGPGCTVERWVHGEKEVKLSRDCAVAARITSSDRVQLEHGCHTPLIYAPSIAWTGAVQPIPLEIPAQVRRWMRRQAIHEVGQQWDIPRRGILENETVFINGDLILDSEAHVEFPLVVRGNLYIRKGALIVGDLKAYGNLLLEQSVVVGSLTAKGDLMIGSGSCVLGCLMSDKLAWLGDGVVIGTEDELCAVVGQRVLLTGRGVVHGRIRALSSLIEVMS